MWITNYTPRPSSKIEWPAPPGFKSDDRGSAREDEVVRLQQELAVARAHLYRSEYVSRRRELVIKDCLALLKDRLVIDNVIDVMRRLGKVVEDD